MLSETTARYVRRTWLSRELWYLFGKRVLREAALAARAAMSIEELAAADAALLAFACDLARGAAVVAGYAPMQREPGGLGLPDALAAVLSPAALLLPVFRPDRDLDWAAYDGTLTAGSIVERLREPPGRRLGVDAIAGADLVFVPALA